jgi:hypothetical protein
MRAFVFMMMLGSTFGLRAQQNDYVLNLNDAEDCTNKMTILLEAFAKGDTATEMKFRYANVDWYYKTRDNFVEILTAKQYLCNKEFMDKLTFKELDIRPEEGMIFRIFFAEKDNPENKHRFVFRVDDLGKIWGVIYIPPITKQYFPELSNDDFARMVELLNNGEPTPENPIEFNFHEFRCGGVMEAIEEVEESL